MSEMENYEAVFLRIHEVKRSDRFGQRSPWVSLGIHHNEAYIPMSELEAQLPQLNPQEWRGSINFAYLGWSSGKATDQNSNPDPDFIYEVLKFPLTKVAKLRDDTLLRLVDQISRETLSNLTWKQDGARTTATCSQLPLSVNDCGIMLRRTFYRRGSNFLEQLGISPAETHDADPRQMKNLFAAQYPRLEEERLEHADLTPKWNSGAAPVVHEGPTLAMKRTNRGVGSRLDPITVQGVLRRIKARRMREEGEKPPTAP